ncbi:MAG: type IX secretion system protein PorQ [Bacteroidetes bacterium]|nr:type IX secretion system protein PorQ [Bacteroidota bacterium]
MRHSFKKIHKLGIFILALFFCNFSLQGQTTIDNIGGREGNAVYNFLTLPYSSKATALGGINISSIKPDLGLAMYNPSLLSPTLDGWLHLSVKPYLAEIKQYDLSGAKYIDKKKLTIGWGVHYMDYGTVAMTDMSGNQLGDFHPKDYSVQLSAAANYFKNIYIGTTIKYIQSNYGLYKSSGLAMDLGLKYQSSNQLSQVSILVKNVGTQLTSYMAKEELPFNLIVGWTKKLENAPFQFSITAEKLSLWRLAYNDTSFNNQQGYTSPGSLQNLFNHLILSGEVFIGDQVSINLGYNFMRRFDLNIQNEQNGFNGFSTGLAIQLPRMEIQYGNAFFQKNMYHHFSVMYQLKNK